MIGLDRLKESLKTLPESPGIYRMIGEDGKPLYIGKAKNIKKRVSSYTHLEKLSNRLQRMVMDIHTVDITTTRTEAEALLLECNLIKEAHPKYNILLKDDKSFPYITISFEGDFPRILKHRGERKKDGIYFGPFAAAGDVNRAIAAIQKAFLIRPCSDNIFKSRTKPCLEYQIKRCSAPCVGKISKEDYGLLVKQAKDFLSGKSDDVQQALKIRMNEASAKLEYEQAAKYRDRIQALASVTAAQSINSRHMDDADIIAIAENGSHSCIQVFFIRGGKTLGNRAFFPKQTDGFSKSEILSAFLANFYANNPPPPEIYLSNELEDLELLEEALSLSSEYKISIHIPERGEKLKFIQMAATNAQESLKRKMDQDGKAGETLTRLAEIFGIENEIQRIEVYDNSHIFGSHAVAAMIVAGPDGFIKNAYRKFNVDSGEKETGGDDYGMLRQVLTRRLVRLKPHPSSLRGGVADVAIQVNKKKETGLLRYARNDEEAAKPDLILIDGGAAHLKIAEEVFADLGISDIPFACIAKGADRNAGREEFHIPGKAPFRLPEKDPLLYYLQNIRDEAHRFAIMSHRSKRAKSITKSVLDSIPGIGSTRKKALLNHFGSVKNIENAGVEEIAQTPGINQKTATIIYDYLHNKG